MSVTDTVYTHYPKYEDSLIQVPWTKIKKNPNPTNGEQVAKYFI
jgi:hypothetical protein